MDLRKRNDIPAFRKDALPAEKEDERYVELKNLEKKIRRPVEIVSFLLGILGILLFGAGLSICLEALKASFTLGVVFGILGLFILLVTYPFGKNWLERRKKRYAKKVLALTDSLLNIQE